MVKRQQISDEVWNDNYRAPGESSLEDTWERQARACAQVESPENREKVYKDFLWLLTDFRGIAGGRITANLGVSERDATTLFNCYVHSPADIEYKDPDSIEGIYDMLKAQALTLKSEGGYGMNFSWIRPAGAYVKGIAGRTPGVLKFMELWDKSSEVITMGSEKVLTKKDDEKKKIRKGAQMACLSCHHPEIEDFIVAKQTPGRLTKFNMSVGITPGFMEAVEADGDWDLIFPDTTHPQYKTIWGGDIEDWKARGLPIIVHKTIKARDLWDKIMKSTYNRNEPGVLFLDVVNKRNPLYYAENVMTTNPCFHGDERFLTRTGYVTFKQSLNDRLCGVFTDNRITYIDDGDGEKAENWHIDLSETGVTFRDSSPAFITKQLAELLELEFVNGQTIRCTPDHHIATSVGMVEAKNLTPEHQILVSIPEPSGESIVGILPETNDEICAFLMGLIAGDGCIYKKYCFIDIWNDDTAVSLVKKLLDKLGVSYCEHTNDEKTRISSIQLRSLLLDKYGFDKKTKHNVPEYIINMARTKIGLFYLSGLYYADGTVSGNVDKGISVRLSQSNRPILSEVQLLLHANGISSRIYLRRESPTAIIKGIKYKCKDQYELITVCGGWKMFGSIIDFKHRSKDAKIQNFLSLSKENYVKENHTSLLSVKYIGQDTVYCIKEDITRSIIVNTITTRRCGEVVMSCGVCLLFSLNLTKYIKKTDKYEFDFDEFRKASEISVRFADNINDISRVPIDDYKKSMQEKRRVGIGVVGLGSLLAVLGIRYGSPEGIELTEKIFKTKAETEILASAKLGKEKGSFPLFDKDKYFSSYWWNTLPISDSIKKEVEKIGCMRNSHRSANAPTGNMSIYAGVLSGGIEPIFMLEYARWGVVTEGVRAELRAQGFQFPDVFKGEFFETEHLKKAKAGNEEVLLGEFNGVQYQVDRNRGLTKKSIVEDWAWSFIKENLSKEEIQDRVSNGLLGTTNELSHKEHVDMLKCIAKYVDLSSSKTINIPNDYPYEDFKDIYMDAWKSGIKGITTYRAGTMTAVLESAEDSKEAKRTAPKRPKELVCNIHTAKVNGHKWVVIIGLLNNEPYEIFAGPAENIDVKNGQIGSIIKRKRGEYCLQIDGEILTVEKPDEDGKLVSTSNIVHILDDPSSAWATRLVSMSLRHGVPIDFTCEQLNKDGFITDINKVLARILKKYSPSERKVEKVCPSCGSKNIKLDEGCLICMDCSFGKCG